MEMLDAKNTFKITGSLPQNVNCAIKGIYVQAMLDTVPEIADKLIPRQRARSRLWTELKRVRFRWNLLDPDWKYSFQLRWHVSEPYRQYNFRF